MKLLIHCLLWAIVPVKQTESFGIAPLPTTKQYHVEVHGSEDSTPDDRRSFFGRVATTTAAIIPLLVQPRAALAQDSSKAKVLVLGGTGLVGSEVVRQLQSKGIPVVATSRNGRDGTVALDVLTQSNLQDEVARLAQGCTAVISTIGAINTADDERVNAASGIAALGAKAAGVQQFVYISNAPEVRESVGGLDFLKGYMAGKAFSEDSIRRNFAKYTLIEPTFIYGGDKFGVNPPRVTSAYGQIIEGLLSLGPFRFAADVIPGFIGLALEPPVSAADVAGAAIAGALSSEALILDTHDKIVDASKSLKQKS